MGMKVSYVNMAAALVDWLHERVVKNCLWQYRNNNDEMIWERILGIEFDIVIYVRYRIIS